MRLACWSFSWQEKNKLSFEVEEIKTTLVKFAGATKLGGGGGCSSHARGQGCHPELKKITNRNLCNQCGMGLEYKIEAERVGFAFSLAKRRPNSSLAYVRGG